MACYDRRYTSRHSEPDFKRICLLMLPRGRELLRLFKENQKHGCLQLPTYRDQILRLHLCRLTPFKTISI